MVCDHLVFVIHGIGGACDMKFRPIHEVVDSYRDLTNNLSKKHFQRAHLVEQVSRYVTYQEFLINPIRHRRGGGTFISL